MDSYYAHGYSDDFDFQVRFLDGPWVGRRRALRAGTRTVDVLMTPTTIGVKAEDGLPPDVLHFPRVTYAPTGHWKGGLPLWAVHDA